MVHKNAKTLQQHLVYKQLLPKNIRRLDHQDLDFSTTGKVLRSVFLNLRLCTKLKKHSSASLSENSTQILFKNWPTNCHKGQHKSKRAVRPTRSTRVLFCVCLKSSCHRKSQIFAKHLNGGRFYNHSYLERILHQCTIEYWDFVRSPERKRFHSSRWFIEHQNLIK